MKSKMMFRRCLLLSAMVVSLILMFPAAGVTEDTGMNKNQQGQQNQQGKTNTQMQQEKGQAAGIEQPQRRIQRATMTLENMMDRTGERIPPEVLQQAQGLAIFPEVTKAGFVVGGRYGKGVLMVKQNEQWNGPVFLSIYGASVGAQIGAQQTDLIMVFNNQNALQQLQDGTLEFGAEASVAAGPWGEKAKASTQADILAYKQTEGVFAGMSLSSGYIEVNPEDNETYFQEETGETRAYYPTPEELIKGEKAPETDKAGELSKVLDEYTKQGGKKQ